MADQRFAEIADLDSLGLPPDAIPGVTSDTKNAALSRASSLLAGRMFPKWEPPFVTWGDDLRNFTCAVAAWLLLKKARGVDPESPEMKNFVNDYNEALAWADDVGAGTIIPVGLVDSTADEDDGSPDVSSAPAQGWPQQTRSGNESDFE